MSVIVGTKAKNLEVARRFSESLYWLPEHAGLFDEAFRLEMPFAPPGWLQSMSPGESRTHLAWMERSVSGWGFEAGRLYSTNFPDIFWLIRAGAGDVVLGGRKGRFESRFLTRLTIRDEKIVHMKEYFNNCSIYKAAGIELPTFIYDAPPADAMPPRGPVPPLSGGKLEENAKNAVKCFVEVDFWEEGGGEIYADSFIHELPFTLPDMPIRYTLREYDALNVWLQENTKTWAVHSGTVLYETDSPGEFIIESAGSGATTWSGIDMGFYQNRHVSYLRVEGGYAVEFFEFFNPLNKFNSINQSIPTIPYLF